MIVSLVGRMARRSSSFLSPPCVTQATSGAKPSTCSASFKKSDSGISSGKYMFEWPVALIMASRASRMFSHRANPYGRITMHPRTGV